MGSKARAGLFVAAMAAFSSFGGGVGCSGERDPINQVQIGALPKAFFVGEKLDDKSDDPEFYFRTTVVDVSSGAGSEELFTSSDAQPTVRIRWEITEDKLVARLSYELIDDTDGMGKIDAVGADAPKVKAPSSTTTDGQVVAAFKITKHFDIRRDYNASTGEENNTVVENDKDRLWFQREYFRVDWSANLITDAYDLDALSMMGMYDGIKWDPIGYYVNDPQSPDAPVIDMPGGYFDITNKAYASPQMIHDEEWGDFPACTLIGEYPRISCNPSEVKLRLSFRKVGESDYEMMDYGGRPMELFGFFTNDRYGYERAHGLVDQKWHRFASRWNLYEKSHTDTVCSTGDTTPAGADPHRDDNHDGTEDECAAAGPGSRCDEFKQRCTVPFHDRKIKTIPWYVNRDYPDDLFDQAKKVVDTWSGAIRVGVLGAKLTECRRTNGASGTCESEHGWPANWNDDFVPPVGDGTPAEVPNVFVLCHNPVNPSVDDPACGKEGLSPRMGDLRYNLITYIVAAQAQAPWGIMVDAEDPLTGEKISGSVNMWGATLDRAAGQLTDLVELLNGSTPPDQFIQGKDVSDWVAKINRSPAAEKTGISADELASRLGAFDPKAMAPFATGKPKTAPKGIPAAMRHTQRLRALGDAGKMGMGNAAIVQRAAKLRGSEIEAKMVTPEIAQLGGLNPKDALTKGDITRASPFGTMSPMFRRSLARRAALSRAHRHSCRRSAPDTDHLVGLVKRAEKELGSPDPKNSDSVRKHRDAVYQWARKNYTMSVFSHEFGHSMGLRHNFAGTFDSLNYDDNYWKLRTKNGSVTKTCAAGTTDGSGCIGPRYNDPITQEEIDGGINGFATASIMDYPGDQALDMYLIGKYDRAAVRFGYGGTVDVWNMPGVSVKGSGDGKKKAYELTGFGDSLGLFGVFYFPQPDSTDSKFIHYSQYNNEFGILGSTMDVVDYRDMQDFAAVPDYASFATTPKVVDPAGRVRRGYIFSSDEYSDSGNVPSFAYDAGADPYEQTRFLEAAYEHRYVLDDFRRGRTTFNSFDVTTRVQSHYLDAIQQLSKTFAFAMVLEVDDPANPTPGLLADGQYGPHGVGASVAFDMFARMLTRPEPGSYCSTAQDTCPNTAPIGLENDIWMADPDPLPATTAYDFKLPLGEGRYVHNDFDYDQGYWWSDYQKQVGSFYDKVWAVYYLSEAFDTFISNSREDFIDGRYKNVSFATVYPEQTRRLFGALLTGDIESFAAWAEYGTGSTPSGWVTYPSWHSLTDTGTRPSGAKIVDPAFGWEEQLYAMVWGTTFFPTSWTNMFIEDARITALAGEQITWPAAQTYTFIDPVTNLTYRAHATGTEKVFGVDKQKGIGARMLDWANNLVYTAYLVETDTQGYYLLNADGTPKLKLDKNGKPQLNPDWPGGDATLRRYVANLEAMRQLVSTFVRPIEFQQPE